MSPNEINRAVARRLGAWVPEYSGEPMYRPYSTSIEAAWEIVEYLTSHKMHIVINCDSWGKREVLIYARKEYQCLSQEQIETAPMAICLAFLKLEGGMAVELSALQAVKAEDLRAAETALREVERRKLYVQEARREALEEAAKIAEEEYKKGSTSNIVGLIRALKEKV